METLQLIKKDKRIKKMQKTFITVASNGVVVIDSTPLAERRFSMMNEIEERTKRDIEKNRNKNKGGLLYQIAKICQVI